MRQPIYGRVDAAGVKARADIAAIIRALGVALHQEGRELIGICPFHEEKTASFHVHRDSQFFYCFGCSAGGDVITFVQRKEGLLFKDAVRRVAELASVSAEEDRERPVSRPVVLPKVITRPPGAARFWFGCEAVTLHRRESNWLARRGLHAWLVERLNLARVVSRRLPRWLPSAWVERMGYALVFPVCDAAGRIVTVRIRTVFQYVEPKARAMVGYTQGSAVLADRVAAKLLGGEPWAREHVRRAGLYVAEGEPDFLTLATLTPAAGWGFRRRADGHPGVVGLFKTAWCREIAERIPEGTQVTLWPHSDAAGGTYAEEVRRTLEARGFPAESIRVMRLRAKDVNELLMHGGRGMPDPREAEVLRPAA